MARNTQNTTFRKLWVVKCKNKEKRTAQIIDFTMQSLQPSAPRSMSKATVVEAPENKNLIWHIQSSSNRIWWGFALRYSVWDWDYLSESCYLVNCHQPNDTKLGHFKFSMTWLSRDIKNQTNQNRLWVLEVVFSRLCCSSSRRQVDGLLRTF